MNTITHFYKLHGCGNDFIIVDIRSQTFSLEEMQQYARILCKAHFSIGADGILFIDNPTDAQCAYRWHFYNADGSRAEMCGNASRCVAYIAYLLGIAPKEHSFQTDVGNIHVIVDASSQRVCSALIPPKDILYNQELIYKGHTYTYHTVNTGVPHAVLFVDDVADVPVNELGAFIRNHDAFAPCGTNVNFLQVLSEDELRIRTYERGVEAETYACGTGAVASVVIAHGLGMVKEHVRLYTYVDDCLEVNLLNGKVLLEAPVAYVFKGELIV